MALILCHECKNEVSTTAKTCPKCGAKVKFKKPTSLAAKIVLGLIIAFVLFGIFHKPDPVTPEQAAETQNKKLRIGAWANAEEAIKKAARDPKSLVFRDIYATENGSVLCLEVNGMNGFGGMTGFERYVYAKGKASKNRNDLNATCYNKTMKFLVVSKGE